MSPVDGPARRPFLTHVEGSLRPAQGSPAQPLPAVLPAPPHDAPARTRGRVGAGARPPLAWAWVLPAAGLVALAHVAANVWSPYGVHRDELLYLAMGDHLRLWAMDFPPFIALLAQLTRLLAGPGAVVESVAVLRLGPALAHAALVGLAAVLARELGGRRGAQLLAALAVAASPLFLRAGSLFQPVVWDQLWWTLGFAALVRLGRRVEATPLPAVLVDRRHGPADRRRTPREGAVQRRRHHTPRDGQPPRRWVPPRWRLSPRRLRWWISRWRRDPLRPDWAVLGAAVGLGLLTKFSIAFFAVGAAVGLAATRLRRHLRTRSPWAAVAFALVLGAPSVVGQVRLGWPVAGQMADLRAEQLARVGPLEFAAGQLLLGPAVLLALLGLAALLGAPRRVPAPPALARGRAAGVAALVAVVLVMLGRGKPYYAGPVYPLLWAAGAVALLEWRRAPQVGWRGRRVRLAAAGLLVAAYGAATLPFGLPVLPPAAMARYAAAMGGGTETNTGDRLELPQDYADMLGWAEQAGAASVAFHALSDDEQREAVVVGGNYGEAGALALYGPRLGLPPAVSRAGSFWFFGPGDREGRVAIVVADSAGAAPELARLFADVRAASPAVPADLRRWVVPEERNAWVFVCRGARRPLHEVWPELRPGAAARRPIAVSNAQLRQPDTVRQHVDDTTPSASADDLPLTDDARQLLAEARGESDRLGHEYVGTEHLVLALTRRSGDPAAAPLAHLGVGADRVRETLAATLTPGAGAPAPGAARPYTSRTQRALALAAESARGLGRPRVGTEHLLVGVMRERVNVGAQVLQHHGLTADAADAHARRLGAGGA